MRLTRYLKPEHVKLDLEHGRVETLDPEKDPEKERTRLRDEVVDELVDLFMATGRIRNRHRFYLDLLNREKKAPTAVGDGLAIPHVRSMQPRAVAVIFARSRSGVEFMAPDGQPVKLFFGITAPPYDDRAFLLFYRRLARSLLFEKWLPNALLEAQDEHEIIKLLARLE